MAHPEGERRPLGPTTGINIRLEDKPVYEMVAKNMTIIGFAEELIVERASDAHQWGFAFEDHTSLEMHGWQRINVIGEVDIDLLQKFAEEGIQIRESLKEARKKSKFFSKLPDNNLNTFVNVNLFDKMHTFAKENPDKLLPKPEKTSS